MANDLTDADIAQALQDPAATWSAGAATIEDFFSDFFDIEGAAAKATESTRGNEYGGNGEATGIGAAGSANTGVEAAEPAHASNDASTAAPVRAPKLAVPGLVTAQQRDMADHFNSRAAEHAVAGSDATNLLQIIEQQNRAGTAAQATVNPAQVDQESEQQASPATNLAQHRRQNMDALRLFGLNSDAQSDGAELDAFFDLDEQQEVARFFGAEPQQQNHAPPASAPPTPNTSAAQASEVPATPTPTSQTPKAPATSMPAGLASWAPQTFTASAPQAPPTQVPQASTTSTPQALASAAAHTSPPSAPAAPTIQVTATTPQGPGDSVPQAYPASAPQIPAFQDSQSRQRRVLDPRFMSQREFERNFPNSLVAPSAFPWTPSMAMPKPPKHHAHSNLFPSKYQGQMAQALPSLQNPQGQMSQSQMPPPPVTQGPMSQGQMSQGRNSQGRMFQQTPAAAGASMTMKGKQAYPPAVRGFQYPPVGGRSAAPTGNRQSYLPASQPASTPSIYMSSLPYTAPQAQPGQQSYSQMNAQAQVQGRPESQPQPHSTHHTQPYSAHPGQTVPALPDQQRQVNVLPQTAQAQPNQAQVDQAQANQAQPNQSQPQPVPAQTQTRAQTQTQAHPSPRKPAKDLTIDPNIPLPSLRPHPYTNTPASAPLLPSSMPNVSHTPKNRSPAHGPPKTAQAKLPSQRQSGQQPGLHTGVISDEHKEALMELQHEYEKGHTSRSTPGAKGLEKDMRTEESRGAVDASSPIQFKGPSQTGGELGRDSPSKVKGGKKRAREDSPLSTRAVAGSARPAAGRSAGEERQSSPDPLQSDGKVGARADRSPPRKKMTRAGGAVCGGIARQGPPGQLDGAEDGGVEQEDDDEDADASDEDMEDVDDDVDAEGSEGEMKDDRDEDEDDEADAEGESDSGVPGEDDDPAAANEVRTGLLFSSSNPDNLSDVHEALLQEVQASADDSTHNGQKVTAKKRASAVGMGRNPIGPRELVSLGTTLISSPMKHPLRQSLSRAATASAKSSPAPEEGRVKGKGASEEKGDWRGRHPLGKDELKLLADGNGVGAAKPSPRKTRRQRESEVEIKKLEEEENAAPETQAKGKTTSGVAKVPPKTKIPATKAPTKGAGKGKAESKGGAKASAKAGTKAGAKGKADAVPARPAAKGKAGGEGVKKSGKGK